MTTEFKKGCKVETRLGQFAGVVIDVEQEGFVTAVRVQFNDGVTKWLRSTDLRFAA